jgi:Na+/H+ antiporter NhaD/arsenite permease-like protein
MNWTTILILLNALLAIGLQVFLPKLRHFIFAIGAFIAIILSTLHGENPHSLFELLPLDVLAILLALELYGDIVIESKIFETMTKFLATICKGKGWLIIISFSLITYFISCFMDNYQCLLLLIPPMLGMLRQVNVSKRYLQIIFGLLIVTSNLGGASTPIGDFPALYMLSQGIINFNSYLLNATPLLLISLTLCVMIALAFYSFKPLTATPQEEQTSVIFTKNLYRNIKINWNILLPALFIFIGMSYFWINGYDATKVAIGGFLVLGLCIKFGRVAEVKIRKKSASTFLYYLFLFVIVVSIQKTGILTLLADYLMNFKDNKQLMLFLFITSTTIVTGIVSAGPSTVAMFPIVQVISPLYPEHMVISCFVLSICAGSSLFLTSATAGPLMSRLTEQYNVIANGQKYSYTFRDYLIPGFIGASIIYLVNLSYIFITL